MHTNRLIVDFVVFCALVIACGNAEAQLLDVTQDALYSNVLKQHRPLEIYLPEEIEKDAVQRCETIYVLDGDWNAQIVVADEVHGPRES